MKFNTQKDAAALGCYHPDFNVLHFVEGMDVGEVPGCLMHNMEHGVYKWLQEAVCLLLKKSASGKSALETFDYRWAFLAQFPKHKRFLEGVSNLFYVTASEHLAMSMGLPFVLRGIFERCELNKKFGDKVGPHFFSNVAYAYLEVRYLLSATSYSVKHDLSVLKDRIRKLQRVLWELGEISAPFSSRTSCANLFEYVIKLHMIIHYPMWIRRFGNADVFNMKYSETAHISNVKQWASSCLSTRGVNNHATAERKLSGRVGVADAHVRIQTTADSLKRADTSQPEAISSAYVRPALFGLVYCRIVDGTCRYGTLRIDAAVSVHQWKRVVCNFEDRVSRKFVNSMMQTLAYDDNGSWQWWMKTNMEHRKLIVRDVWRDVCDSSAISGDLFGHTESAGYIQRRDGTTKCVMDLLNLKIVLSYDRYVQQCVYDAFVRPNVVDASLSTSSNAAAFALESVTNVSASDESDSIRQRCTVSPFLGLYFASVMKTYQKKYGQNAIRQFSSDWCENVNVLPSLTRADGSEAVHSLLSDEAFTVLTVTTFSSDRRNVADVTRCAQQSVCKAVQNVLSGFRTSLKCNAIRQTDDCDVTVLQQLFRVIIWSRYFCQQSDVYVRAGNDVTFSLHDQSDGKNAGDGDGKKGVGHAKKAGGLGSSNSSVTVAKGRIKWICSVGMTGLSFIVVRRFIRRDTLSRLKGRFPGPGEMECTNAWDPHQDDLMKMRMETYVLCADDGSPENYDCICLQTNRLKGVCFMQPDMGHESFLADPDSCTQFFLFENVM